MSKDCDKDHRHQPDFETLPIDQGGALAVISALAALMIEVFKTV